MIHSTAIAGVRFAQHLFYLAVKSPSVKILSLFACQMKHSVDVAYLRYIGAKYKDVAVKLNGSGETRTQRILFLTDQVKKRIIRDHDIESYRVVAATSDSSDSDGSRRRTTRLGKRHTRKRDRR